MLARRAAKAEAEAEAEKMRVKMDKMDIDDEMDTTEG